MKTALAALLTLLVVSSAPAQSIPSTFDADYLAFADPEPALESEVATWYLDAAERLLGDLAADGDTVLQALIVDHYDPHAYADLMRYVHLMKRSHGAIQGFDILGVRPHATQPRQKVETYVRVAFADDTRLWRLVWRDDLLVTISTGE